MKITVVAVGRVKDEGIRCAAEDYRDRLSHHLSVDETEVLKVKRGRGEEVKSQEGEALLRSVPDGALVIAMTEDGKKMSSLELAQRVRDWMVEGRQDVVFLIGGAYGLSQEVKKRANLRLSLSAMTFPHDIARMLLWEQLYRAMTIIRGEPYHK